MAGQERGFMAQEKIICTFCGNLAKTIQTQIYTELISIPVFKQVNSEKKNLPENIQAMK